MFRGFVVAFCILLAAVSSPPVRAEKVQQLKPQGYVNDFAGVLGEQAKSQLEALCAEVDQKLHAQIAVVTVKRLEGLEASDFANRLFAQWGVGHRDDNRGVLILLATADHKYWIEVGYGLEPILPDGKVGGFAREMVPKLRAGAYDRALLQLADEIAGTIAQDRGVMLDRGKAPAPPEPPTAPPRAWNDWNPVTLFFVVIFLYYVGKVILAFFLATSRWLLGGPRKRAQGWSRLWLAALGASWLTRGGGGIWRGGGFGGGIDFSSGGGGFGGFGGGSSGGGGAGGSW